MKKLYYYCRDNNFGDQLAVALTEHFAGRKLATENGRLPDRVCASSGGNLVTLGSIAHLIEQHDTIWGTGVNPQQCNAGNFDSMKNNWKSADIRAIRGPLSRQFLQERFGIECPEIYGDPALLISELIKKTPEPSLEFGVLPHMNDLMSLQTQTDDWKKKGGTLISPLQAWQDVVAQIQACNLIISSSLHGIIVAEALGIPSRWLCSEELPSFTTEGVFKYNDYYASTNRSQYDFAKSISDAIAMAGKEAIADFDVAKLKKAFPLEMCHEIS